MEQDEIEAAALLRPLAREPRTPPAVDIGKAIADGTRRQRTHRVAASGAAAMATVAALAGGWALFAPDPTPGDGTSPDVAAASPSGDADPTATGPKPPTACTVRQLEMPDGQPPMSVVTGADPTGRYVVGRSYPSSEQTPRILIWDNGKVTAVAMAGNDQTLRDVNSTGVAVGYSFVGASNEEAAWVYRDGEMSRLAGRHAEAHGINDSGVIVGSVNGRPALWRSPTSEPAMLATPGEGWVGQATGIDEDGTVVGRLASDETGPQAGYLWRPDGTLVKLLTPTVRGEPATMYTADEIRRGWVSGWARRDEGTPSKVLGASPRPGDGVSYIAAPRWNLRTGTVETPENGPRVEGINRHGWTVGDGPVLMAEGRTVRLPTLGHDAGPMTSYVYTISDDGRTLAGQVQMKDEDPAAAVWRCR